MNLINLSQAVIKALEFFSQEKPPRFKTEAFKFPLVVGSGNAYNTGLIIFSKQPAFFADESTFKQTIKNYEPLIKKGLIKEAIIISASGEKDSVWELELAKKYKLKNYLLTCSPNSSAAKIAGKTISYRKIAEPYTYNVSTYLGMILSASGEKAKDILRVIKNLELPKNFSSYKAYAFILPDEHINICSMLDIKGRELFGPHLQVRAYPEGHARHAKFVNPSKQELVISLGVENKYFGEPKNRLAIKLNKEAKSATIIALGYYLIGLIQAKKPGYFKKNIKKYCTDYGPKAYGSKKSFEVIVPGN